jgi:hypothetical protein
MKTLTDQQKLEILCAYLPYGVEVRIKKRVGGVSVNRSLALTPNSISSVLPFNPKLILRHPDDMTEEEILKLVRHITGENNPVSLDFVNAVTISDYITNIDGTAELTLAKSIQLLNYLHSLHIDTFGAIEAGFAVRKNINEKG